MIADALPPIPPTWVDAVLGPLGALALALVVLYYGFRFIRGLIDDHLRSDLDDRQQRDTALRLLEAEQANAREQISAWNRRNELEAARGRRADR